MEQCCSGGAVPGKILDNTKWKAVMIAYTSYVRASSLQIINLQKAATGFLITFPGFQKNITGFVL